MPVSRNTVMGALCRMAKKRESAASGSVAISVAMGAVIPPRVVQAM